MKAVQIDRYSKDIDPVVRDIPVPEPSDGEVLIKMETAAVNPVDLLIMTRSVKLIQGYRMPLTLGNECSGTVRSTGRDVSRFKPGDRVYARLPVDRIGAFAEYVAVDQDAIAHMPEGYCFEQAAAIPLTGLTAWQGITEELEAEPGQTLLITGGSGSFGQIAVPIAKSLGLKVVVTGNSRSRDRILSMGADRYIDYRQENYWEVLDPVDHIIDTLGQGEFEHELSVLKPGGRLLSLRTGPNKEFARRNSITGIRRVLFSLAGSRYDRAARRQGKYRFIFVRADGRQLEEITKVVEERGVSPTVDSRTFTLEQAGEALELVRDGRIDGKVIIRP